MKNFILINGTMGAGKTTVSRALQKLLPQAVFLDGDWCWMMSPFQVQDQTKAMVMDNIVYLLNQFLAQACFDHVLFSWVMDQPETVQQIYNRLQGNFTFYHFTLLPSSTQLRRQLQQDIDRGLRTADCIPQSLSRLTHYDQIESEKIKINGQSPETITREILSRLK